MACLFLQPSSEIWIFQRFTSAASGPYQPSESLSPGDEFKLVNFWGGFAPTDERPSLALILRIGPVLASAKC
jgi:hypothetical protein